MRGLGRLLALPFLLIALVAQSLAPAEAASMRPDPPALGICSAAHELGGAPHRQGPAKSQDHDCCAFACAIASLAAAPPVHALAAHVAYAAPAGLAAARRSDARAPSPLARPRARGPPSTS